MVHSHCETLWADNSESGLVSHSTEYYRATSYNTANWSLIYQQCLISKILSLWIRNFITTDAIHKVSAYKTSYAYNIQYYGATLFFVIVKLVFYDTSIGLSYKNTKLDTMKLSWFKHNIPK